MKPKTDKKIQQYRLRKLQLENVEKRLLFSADSPFHAYADIPVNQVIPAVMSSANDNQHSESSDVSEDKLELVIIDSQVPELDKILADLQGQSTRQFDIYVLNSETSGLDQVTQILDQYQNIGAIHLFSHGQTAELNLGSDTVSLATLLAQAEQISSWDDNLAENGDLLIYGCDLASSQEGESFVAMLGDLTGTDVAASADLTGDEKLGGDWALEFSTGKIETSLAVTEQFQSTYEHTLATYTVTNLADSGAGSLRQAIIDSNSTGDADVIDFSIAGSITLTTALPSINSQVNIDGTTAPGYSGQPLITLNGTAAGSANALTFDAGSDGSAVSGLSIINFTGIGIYLNGSNNNTISGNYIGTDGSADFGNSATGISIINSSGNIIGGANSSDRNIISGNDQDGISLWGATTDNNTILGNYLGTDATGTNAIGNAGDGIWLGGGASSNIIGGSNAGEKNLVSGNGNDGIEIVELETNSNVIHGNHIGTDITGTVTLGNARYGVILYSGVQSTEIGGDGDGEGNLISGNGSFGVVINGNMGNTTINNTISGNQIGTNITGDAALANISGGILLQNGAINNTVGGTSSGAGNTISGNIGHGIEIDGGISDGNVIKGNTIGVTSAGNVALENTAYNILISNSADDTIIGDSDNGNLIGGGTVGIYIDGSSTGTVIQGNAIGTDFSGAINLGHSENGITIDNNAYDNLVGGTTVGAGNIIGYNGTGGTFTAGIALTNVAGSGNSILGNRFINNEGLSIDIERPADGLSGVTPNDILDIDIGPNDVLNFPVLFTGAVDGTSVTITGELEANASSKYRIEFYSTVFGSEDATGHGEAHIFLGAIEVTTDLLGSASINDVLLGVNLADQDRISAITTEIIDAGSVGIDDKLAYGSTSEVSLNIAADIALVAIDDSGDFHTTVLSHAPVSHWMLGESSGSTAVDSGTAANNATLVGGTLQQTGAITGNSDTAIALNGVSDHVETAHIPAYNMAEGTLQLWFNANNTGSFQSLFSKFSNTPDYGHTAGYIDPSGFIHVVIEDNGTSYTVSSTSAVSFGDWHLVTFTFGTQGMKLYVNGDQVDAEASFLGGWTNNSEPLAFGMSTESSTPGLTTPGSSFLWGKLDEISLFSEQLTASDVLEMYHAAKTDYTVSEGGTLSIDASEGVLINDFDPDGFPLTASLISGPSFASSFSFTINGGFTYQHNGSETTSDSFVYQVSNGNGDIDQATVYITIEPVNDLPVITSSSAFNAAEEQTSIGTITSTDPDSGLPQYSLVGATDDSLFSIDINTGVLTFNASPDFETPADIGADNIYDITVQVDDQNGGINTQNIAITITDVNDLPVITSLSAFGAAENQIAAGTVTSLDADGNPRLYTLIGSTDDSLFGINTNTGLLTFNAAPDFETPTDVGTDNTYNVTVQVDDQNGGIATQNIAITVSNVNEAPIVTSPAAFGAAENQTAVGTVTSTDVDAGIPLYTLIGSTDDSLFGIDVNTGVITFNAAPDFETPADVGADNIYNITVQVDDQNGGLTTQNIAITVSNVNELPTITSSAAFGLAENQTAVGTITSSDIDGSTPLYTLVGSTDDSLFGIDTNTGALTFNAAPDFETPTDVGADNVYNVTVQVDDQNGGFATQNIAITVSNVNEAPIITSPAAFGTAENQTAVGTVTSTDVDAGVPLYALTGSTDDSLFGIDVNTGVLTFNAAPDFESPADVGADNIYNVTVQVDDQNGGLTTQNIAITVSNVNEAPIITSPATFGAAENQTAVGTVTSTDVDAGVPLYTLTGSTDDSLFGIDVNTGVLTFNAAPDFESPADVGADNIYNVTVQVDDQNGGLTTQNIAITVSNVNELPTITSSAAFGLAENQTAVGTITSSDVDGSTPLYTLVGSTDDSLFGIDTNTGALTFNAAPDFETPADVGTDNVYNVTVQVDDQNGGFATQNIAITVSNVNEAPIITSPAAFGTAENQTAVGTVTSSDVDAGIPLFTLTGSTDDSLFGIDVNTGVLTFNAAPDFESPADVGADNIYNVTVQVDDQNGGLTTQNIAITVSNVNELPVITSSAVFGAAENQTAVGTVTSTDVDGGAPLYTLIGSTDDTLFGIDTNTGVLTFNAAPDFESPADVGADNIYNVTVQVDDQNGGLATQNIAITVSNVNEAPIITSPAAFGAAENQTAVGTVTSTDVDAGVPLYTLTGSTDDSLFGIDVNTGVLTFNAAPDFESPADVGADNIYNVTVQVDDQNGGLTTQNIAITVSNVNELPTITSSAAFGLAENQTAVGTITSTDVDGSTPLYTLVGSTDDSLFGIDTNTGALTFNAAPDFETPADVGTDNVYNVTVQVDDQNGGLATQNIAITVSNVNEAPIITSPATFGAAENQTAVGTVTSTDVDAGVPLFTLTGSTDDSLFGIDVNTGVLTFNAAPDFESPADVGADNIYNVTVQVDDQNGGLTTQNFAITVSNINELPAITSSAAFGLAENQTTVGTITSSDVDGSTPLYTLVGSTDDTLFGIDTNTGVLTFNAAPDFESPADVGADNIYNVTVQVDDQNGGFATQNIAITVSNVNEAPIITSPAAFGAAENQTAVGTVTSTDVDAGIPLFTLTGSTDDSLFGIDVNTGVLTFNAAPDFESPADVGADNIYNVTVQVDDQNGGLTTQNFAITVSNINELPTITSSAAFGLAENQTTVGTITSSDVDGSTPLYTLVGSTDDTLFGIDTNTGVLTFNAAPDFESPADVGADNIYNVTVQVDDQNGGLATQNIAITVSNVNEAPIITSPATFGAAENQTAVGTVTSTDVDAGVPLYTLTGSTDDSLFGIDVNTGVLTFNAAPDFESPADVGADNIYNVTVQVDDQNGGLTTQSIAITVSNVNELPVITSSAVFGAAENQTAVGTITSTDVDGGAPLYTLIGSTDDTLFGIDTNTGILTFNAAPDFETPADVGADNVYNVTVQVDDQNGGVVTQNIAITVSNDNELPVITSSAAFGAAENQTAVGTITSTDVDGGAPLYTLIGSTDDSLFGIDTNTGTLTFNAAPDFETPADVGADNIYNVTVQVDDQNGGLTTQNIAITVSNVNELPTITSSAAFGVAENQTAVGTITSSDVDGNAPLYTLIGSTDDSLFGIDTNTGVLTFNAAPDFESPADTGADNTYNVTVQVDDQNGGVVTQNIAITVSNVNELPTITSSAAFGVAENQTAVGTITSSDVDGSAPLYTLIGSTDDTLFGIDTNTGVLTFNAAPDFETPTDVGADNIYNVTVQVDDQNGGLTTQNIAITVSNVNELPVITSSAAFGAAENQTAVGTVTSTDADGAAPLYTLIGSTDDTLFGIDTNTGILTFNAAPDFEAPTDVGADNIYNVTVQVDDQNGGLTTQNIAIAVSNVNELPVITSSAAFGAAENQTAVGTITSTDVDGGAALYTLIGSTDDTLFGIDTNTGVLTFNAAPDFETPADVGADNIYNVTVQVDDQNGGLTTQNIAITVSNDNELPVITSSAAFGAAENQTTVGTITSSDVDGSAPLYTLIGSTDDTLFGIDTNTGVLTFNAAPDFETPADVGADNIYNVTVQVDDQNGGLTTQNIAITVSNVNELPVITSSAAFGAAENQTAVGTVTSTDVDGGAPLYTLIGSTDDTLFGIDTNTGILTFNAAPDFETPADVGADNIYNVTVQVDDQNGGLTTQNIAITVSNVNELPVITSSAAFGAAENQTAVGTITSTDVDGGAALYTLIGSTDDTLFGIDTNTGVLTFNAAPDFETPTDAGADNIYNVTIQVDDQNGGVVTQNIAITVSNDNELPVITSSAAIGAAENQTAVGTITSTDVDGSSPLYSLIGSIDDSLFGIDTNTGVLTFNAAPDFETPADVGADNIYNVTVQVDDQNGGLNTQNIAITVSNVNELPVITSSAAFGAAENQTAVGTVTSTDVDGGAPLYTLIGSTDDTLFGIDTNTGILTFNAAPDFETPTDVGADNIYNVTVQVDDQNGGVTNQSIAISVSNANELPVITSPAMFGVLENQTAAGNVTSIDTDGSTAIYSLIGSTDDSLLSIDSNTGVLSFNIEPDFEAPRDVGGDNTYNVTVQVDDQNGGVTSQSISIVVNNENEAPVAVADLLQGTEDSELLINVNDALLSNDIDIDGEQVSITSFTQPEHGTLIDNLDGTFTYSPESDFFGVDNFQYQITDADNVSSLANVEIIVQSVNDAPILTSVTTHVIGENTNASTSASSATDVDGSSILVSISGGPDASLFEINQNTGELQFLTSPDFENPLDQNRDNLYEIELTATDEHGDSTSQSIQLAVTDVNEAPTLEVINITGIESFTGTIGQLQIVDPDTGDLASVTITGGTASHAFGVDVETGELIQQNSLIAGTYTLDITITDSAGASSFATLQVRIFSSDDSGIVASPALPGESSSSESITDLITSAIENSASQSELISTTAESSEEISDSDADSSDTEALEAELDSAELMQNNSDGESFFTVQNRMFMADGSSGMPSAQNDQTADESEQKGSDGVVRGYKMILELLVEQTEDLVSSIGNSLDLQPFSITLTPRMLEAMNELSSDIDELEQREKQQMNLVVQTSVATSVSLTAGFVTWLLRTGTLAATAMTTSPLWRSFDPIPVLGTDVEDQENE